jgi:hypothetical protein
MDRSTRGVYSFCFDGERAYHHPDVDLINVAHPFLKAAVTAMRQQLDKNMQARTARTILPLAPGEDDDLGDGTYFVLVFLHTIDGIRARTVLETVVWHEDRRNLLPAESGERMMHLILERGLEWDPATTAPPLPPDTWARMISEARSRNRSLLHTERRENEALFVRRKALLEAEFQHIIEVKTRRLRTAEENGKTKVLAPLRGQISKAEAAHRARLADFDKARETRCRLSDPFAACLVRILRSS